MESLYTSVGTQCIFFGLSYTLGRIGFIAFSTIGYGDYSPATPAGRSVFVVWALLGVGAMTILVSGKFTFLRAVPMQG